LNANRDTLPEISRNADVLRAWPESCTWKELQEAAAAIGPLLRRHLELNEVWDLLPAAERAAVLWVTASGVKHSPSSRPPQEQYLSSTIRELLDAVDYFGKLYMVSGTCRLPHQRSMAARDGEEFAVRFVALPEGWRGEVVRRIRAGEDFEAAISNSAVSRNILRSVYGIDGARKAAGNAAPPLDNP